MLLTTRSLTGAPSSCPATITTMSRSKAKGIILGYGNMGRTHHIAAQACGAEIIAVVDPDPTALSASNLPGYKNPDALPQDIDPDFAVISNPSFAANTK